MKNFKVYTILQDEDTTDTLKLKNWDELNLFMIPFERKPIWNDDIIIVQNMRDVNKWDIIDPDWEIKLYDIVVYKNNVSELPNGAKKKFIKACFNGEKL